ncbi:MAG TPA: bacillithiol biosynthesis deacetylase BshB1 [Chitinophagales bacterium]|nr:bacillithiol biosynthesis deacetylase BshB1 [Chitinophagales bacterium]
MKLDLLAFSAHPDDVELSCAGTIIKHVTLGKKAGIIDLTHGELGTRGTPEIRDAEAAAATKVMGVHVRENLNMRDGFFQNDEEHQLKVITMLRKYQPEIVVANAVVDRHPDHGRAAELVREACFLSGLKKIETKIDDQSQEPWRPRALYHYLQDMWLEPDVLIDISGYWEKRMEAVMCFRSQFYNPNSKEPVTYISTPEFLESLKYRAQTLGRMIGVDYAENFTTTRKTGVDHFFVLK